MKKQIQQALDRRLTNFWKTPEPKQSPVAEKPHDLRTLRKGIPQKTRTLPSIEAFLIENLRGPAIKSGCVVIIGHNQHTETIASRVKSARLFAKRWHTPEFIEGASATCPPALPENIAVNTQQPLDTVGALLSFEPLPDGIGLNYEPKARVMGTLDNIRSALRGQKFTILNRFHDFLCVELI